MSDALLMFVCASGVLLAEFFGALGCYSLRGFSRSRLDEICRLRGDEARFGVVLRRAESALLVAEIVYALISLAVVILGIGWLELWQLPAAGVSAWAVYLFELLAFAVVFVLVAVIVPWSTSRVAGERFLYRAWPLLNLLLVLSAPVLTLSRRLDTIFHRMSGREEPPEGDAATITEEILTVVEEGQREGLLESGAGTMIHRVMDMAQEDVAAIMTPRTDMVCIHVDSSLEEAREKLLAAGHSRIPIIDQSADDIVGILYAKDLLRHMDSNGKPVSLREIVREPIYVPETTRIDNMLETMKRQRVQMAIILDEYGGVAGLVTMEDVLEEIVGEIVDEYDAAEEEGISQIAPNVHEVDARVHIDDLNEQFGFDLPEDEDFDTIGGFTFTQFGRIPRPNESFTWGQLRITVLEADKRKLKKLRIEQDPTLAAASTAQD